jgi:hypothetical protein
MAQFFKLAVILVVGAIASVTGNGSPMGSSYSNVLTTKHSATESGSCQLPAATYASGLYPVALGDIASLGDITYSPGMCGHVLRLNCGNGNVDLIISNSNLGGGLDLYASAWNLATNNAAPGQKYCTVQRTDGLPLASYSGPVCYYSPEGEKNNDYYKLLGLFNTGSKTVASASYNGVKANFNGVTSYLAFYNGPFNSDSKVTFTFTDGTTHTVKVSDCVKENSLKIWS